MEIYQSEQEQAEALKQWWRENTRVVIGVVVIGLGAAFAVWTWRDYHKTQAEKAAVEYGQLVVEVKRGAAKEGFERGVRIMGEFSGTPYAVLAALANARLALDNGDVAAARTQLEWALAHARETSLQQLARLRLARVMLEQGEAQAAFKLMSGAEAGGYSAEYVEVQGDIHLALKQPGSARSAWLRALQAVPAGTDKAALLQMKLDDLGAVNTSAPSTAPSTASATAPAKP
ncbi:MAG: tetratricopeptide repeat protein [Proteobacteria bacterium]|nr:tetratricopeptide repeat protein [Pseudomonadota bacterium]